MFGATEALAAPALTQEVTLSAEGGVSFKTPKWRIEKKEAALSVLERAPDPAKKQGFALLVLTIEEGPKTIEGLDWSRVRDNVVAAAKAAGSALLLEVGDAYEGATGFTGRHLSGSTKIGKREVKVEMIALVAPGVLVTTSSVGRNDDPGVAALAKSVAQSAKRPSDP